MSDHELNRYLSRWKKRVDKELNKLIPNIPNNKLQSAMRYALIDSGKRFRPILCIASAEAAGGAGEDVLSFACAIEMIHTYSLIHDDLPCMDNADTRRGKPSCHRAFGEALAVLAGDGLLTEAFRIMTEVALYPDHVRKNLLQAVNLISRAVGIEGMVLGQTLDISVTRAKKLPLRSLNTVNFKKTALLISASAASGAILVAGLGRVSECIRRYGENLGMAFQLMDDLHDIDKDEPSIPGIYGEKVARDLILRYINKSHKSLHGLGSRAVILHKIVDKFFNDLQVV